MQKVLAKAEGHGPQNSLDYYLQELTAKTTVLPQGTPACFYERRTLE